MDKAATTKLAHTFQENFAQSGNIAPEISKRRADRNAGANLACKAGC